MGLNSERKINKREAIPAASYIYSGRVNLSWVLGKNTSELQQGNCREMTPSLKNITSPCQPIQMEQLPVFPYFSLANLL